MTDADASSQRLERAGSSLLKEKNKRVQENDVQVNGADSSLVVTAKTNGSGHLQNGRSYEEHAEELNGEPTANGGQSDLNDVIQHQLQPLLESVSLNGTSMNELQQQLAAQFKQQNAPGNLLLGNSNGSSSSTSPPLKTSESSISPAAQSTSHQISSASSSSILSSGSHSNSNWNGQQQQSSLSSISPNDEATGSTGHSNLLENISSHAAAAAAWTSACSQQQISPSEFFTI